AAAVPKIMKRLWLLIPAILIILALPKIRGGNGSGVTKQEIATGIEIAPAVADLGQVVYGEVAQTSFTLTNFTPTPLTITRVSTSCGCTKAKASAEKLTSYASTQIDVTFDPAVHQDDTDLGELTRTIYIETDNVNFPKVTAEIKAVVIKKQTEK
ncbi:MAG: DUF1573 domain-containing protein, partial [Patescibacteria group bacterium]